MLALMGFTLLVRICAEFKKELDHVGKVQPNACFQGSIEDVRVFLVVDIGANVELLSSTGLAMMAA